MSNEKRRIAAPAPGEEESIAVYLRDNPDFFDRHPKLLEDMVVPHSCGGAVSLVEYQVGVLRDQVHELRRRMQSLANNARDNEALSQRLHQLTLSLVECTRLDEVLTNLYQSMGEDFKADFAAIRLFADPLSERDQGLGEFVGSHSDASALFPRVLASNKPICGHLEEKQLAFLFPENAAELGSGALLPLGQNSRFGVLAIGSRDAQRFHPGMGTIFLRQLGDIVSRVLAPHIATS
jgi:uncharacterized protein